MSEYVPLSEYVRISVQYTKCPDFCPVYKVSSFYSFFSQFSMYVLISFSGSTMSGCMSHVRLYVPCPSVFPCPSVCPMSGFLFHVRPYVPCLILSTSEKKFRGTDTYTHICASVILCVSVPMCAFIMCAYCACVPFNNLCMCPPMSCL